MKGLWKPALWALAGAAGLALAADPIGMGTFKMDPSKSTFNPGPPPKSLTTTFQPDGNKVKWKSERVGADGKTATATYHAAYDGKPYPIEGSPTADTVVLKRIDAYTSERVNMKGGQVVTTERRVVAKDGKSYFTTVTGKTAKGEPIDIKMHFDKQ